MIEVGYYDFMLDVIAVTSRQVGIYWVGHILDSFHRVCFILSKTMIKNLLGFCWVFFLLLGTFTLFVYGNLTLSTQ